MKAVIVALLTLASSYAPFAQGRTDAEVPAKIVVMEKGWSRTHYRPGWDRQIILNQDPNPRNPNPFPDGRNQRRRMGKPIEGFTYKAKVQNTSAKTVVLIGWDYRFTDSESKKVTSHQFYSRMRIDPGKKKELAQFTREPPTRTVSATAASTLVEEVIINYVEYEDGTVWRP